MSSKPITRRVVLRAGVVTAVAMPLAVGVIPLASQGCRSSDRSRRDGKTTRVVDDPPTLTTVLRALLLAIGPWGAGHEATATSVVDRFLTDERVRQYADSTRALLAIFGRFAPRAPLSLDEIELAAYSPDQRRALLKLVDDLYAILEVRFFIAGQPPPGACIGDPLWHTRAPQAP